MKLSTYVRTVVMLALLAAGAPGLQAEEPIEGFTEPYRTIHVAAAESGIVNRVFVREGEVVKARQPVVALDDEVHRMLLDIAKQQMEATGRLDSASAELELHQSRFDKLVELRRAGQAYQQEVDRARADVEVARGRFLAMQEESVLKRLEHKKIQVQLERRTVTAPVDGIVTALRKNPGEYVSPVDPEVITIVQLNPLRATFLMDRAAAQQVQPGQRVTVTFTDASISAPGIVEYVSELTDAESGTVPVKVRVDNSEAKYRSGERCTLGLK